jgi:hypothetical protein
MSTRSFPLSEHLPLLIIRHILELIVKQRSSHSVAVQYQNNTKRNPENKLKPKTTPKIKPNPPSRNRGGGGPLSPASHIRPGTFIPRQRHAHSAFACLALRSISWIPSRCINAAITESKNTITDSSNIVPNGALSYTPLICLPS